MIPHIQTNFSDYASLYQATITHNDMGERTISTQIKIHPQVKPNFGTWEIIYKGERYIQPLRSPQSKKDDTSKDTFVDLVFHHWATYELKRYFFTEKAMSEAGIVNAYNNFIFPINLSFKEFINYLGYNIEKYYGGNITIALNDNPKEEYSDIVHNWSFKYTSIWDVLQDMYEVYGVRWHWAHDIANDVYTIMVGYDAEDITHIFAYGYESGLTSIERQVQNADIRNRLYGRGGSRNIPYRYFKKAVDINAEGAQWKGDPDWIPELENVVFTSLRGKTFRDYVRGWKAKHYDGLAMDEPTEAYSRGYTDTSFNPIEYVEDKESIEKYGLILGGLDDNENIFPTIQKRDLGDGLGRADEVIDVEEVLVDEPTSNQDSARKVLPINSSSKDIVSSVNQPRTLELVSNIVQVPIGSNGYFVKDCIISAIEEVGVTDSYYRFSQNAGLSELFETRKGNVSHPLNVQTSWVKVIDAKTSKEISDITKIEGGTKFYVHASVVVSNFYEGETIDDVKYPYYNSSSTLVRTPKDTCGVTLTLSCELNYTRFNGVIIGNYSDGTKRITRDVSISGGSSSRVTLQTDTFAVPEQGSSLIDMAVRIKSSDSASEYSYEPTINAVNVATSEVLSPINLDAGTYYLRVVVDITNLSRQEHEYKVELMPAYVQYPTDTIEFVPTFDIWIKNIWGTKKNANENNTSYSNRVWTPILGDKSGDEAKVVFSSGLLSGHSDYEFSIVSIDYDTSKSLNGVPSEWRITLSKSDAEVDATSKWLPSTLINAKAGDTFYFIGIDMPHDYVVWAETEVDKYKIEEVNKSSDITPTWIIGLDKVRLHAKENVEASTLFDNIGVGRIAQITNDQLTDGVVQKRYVQAVTWTWENGQVAPNIDVVLADYPISPKTLSDKLEEYRQQLSVEVDDIKGYIRNSIEYDRRQNWKNAQNDTTFKHLYEDVTANKEWQDEKNEELTGMAMSAMLKVYKEALATIKAEFASIESLLGQVMPKPIEWLDYLDAYNTYKSALELLLSLNNPDSINIAGIDAARSKYVATRDALLRALGIDDARILSKQIYEGKIAEVIAQRDSILQELFKITGEGYVLVDGDKSALADSTGALLYEFVDNSEYGAYNNAANDYIAKMREMIDTLNFVEDEDYRAVSKAYYAQYNNITSKKASAQASSIDFVRQYIASTTLSSDVIWTINTNINTELLRLFYDAIVMELDIYEKKYPNIPLLVIQVVNNYKGAAKEFINIIGQILGSATSSMCQLTTRYQNARDAYRSCRNALILYEIQNK
jgi:hypothetical protein